MALSSLYRTPIVQLSLYLHFYIAPRKIKIHTPPPSTRALCKDPVKAVEESQRPTLDPSGSRTRLFSSTNPDRAQVGDILHTTFKTGEPFSGVIISIKKRGIHTSVLLRNQLTRIGTEMSIKVFSPLVRSMEVAQRTVKRKRRARLYYMRQPKHDMGSVQKVVDAYLRRRAALMGTSGVGAPGGAGRRGALGGTKGMRR